MVSAKTQAWVNGHGPSSSWFGRSRTEEHGTNFERVLEYHIEAERETREKKR
jgi:hypothetical protein